MASPTQPQDRKVKTDPRAMQRVKLGGKSRLLRFDANAIIEVCDATGIDDIEEVLEAAGRMNIKVLRAGLWAGLLHEDDQLDQVDVGGWIGDGKDKLSVTDGIVALVAAISAAIGVDLTDMQQAVDGADPTRRGGTGRKQSAPRSPSASPTPSSGG